MIHKIIVIVLDVEADSYEDALLSVKELNVGEGTFFADMDKYKPRNQWVNYSVPEDFEHDEEGQRVLYLPPEDGKIIDRTKLPDDRCLGCASLPIPGCPIHDDEQSILTKRYFVLESRRFDALNPGYQEEDDEERNEIVEKLGYTPSK